ncbi:MAG: helix-hairpin-helix domain-containing protein [Deltaproteobacteria bacterium]|nr:helix-hairpin-helix domain-containing protein [Deltaproteobacteria bacterium]
MKIVTVFMAVLFVFVLGFSTLPGDVYAKTSSEKMTAKKAETTKSTTKAKKKAVARNIDINKADKETLTQIPGIGPKTADSILQYRKANGKFKSVNDLTNVKGIGDKSLAKMKPFLRKI